MMTFPLFCFPINTVFLQNLYILINIPTMNKGIFAVLALLAAAAVLYSLQPESTSEERMYLNYLREFSKPIPNGNELIYRAKIFAEYVRKMQAHNADSTQTYKMGINQFSDLTQIEFVTTYLGDMGDNEARQFNKQVNAGFNGQIDWRKQGIVTAVKNQGQCGSCWAFGATAAHESFQVQFNKQDISINLSEQQLVDCSGSYGNHGCNGGLASNAMKYIAANGQTTTSNYAYTARDQTCKLQGGPFKILGVQLATGCNVLEGLLQTSPVAVRVDASNWSSYRSGIFSNCATNINHAVFMVGTSEDAWTIKNSWGTSWGENGYIRLKKGNTCNVCYGPSYPTRP